MKKQFLAGAVCVLTAIAAPTVLAQAYPTHPVRIVVPFTAGGGSDIIARVVGQKMAENMKQSFVIENKPGAGGSIGTQEVAKSAADGYTLLLATSSTHGVNPWLYAKLPYDPVKDFTPVSILATTDYALAVSTQVPVTTLDDLIKLGKGGTINFGSSGNGTTGHLSGALLSSLSKTPFQHVPYKGGAQALNDVVGGQVSFMIDNTSVLAPHAKAGKVRLLATTGPTRSRVTMSVPTMAESGMPNFKVIGWWALLAPANTPKAIVDRLNREVVKAMNSPDVRERIAGAGNDPLTMSSEDSKAFIESELIKFKEIVGLAGVKLE